MGTQGARATANLAMLPFSLFEKHNVSLGRPLLHARTLGPVFAAILGITAKGKGGVDEAETSLEIKVQSISPGLVADRPGTPPLRIFSSDNRGDVRCSPSP
jgi:hypothetical protein